MSANQFDRLQSIASSIEYISGQLSENDSDFADQITQLQKAASDFNIQELNGLALNLTGYKGTTQEISQGIEMLAERVRVLSTGGDK